MSRRERWGIIGAILGAVDEEAQRGVEPRLTNLAAKANISHDRLRAYLEQLRHAGLLDQGPFPTLTPTGREFLRQYREWLRILHSTGLFPPQAGDGLADRAPTRVEMAHDEPPPAPPRSQAP